MIRGILPKLQVQVLEEASCGSVLFAAGAIGLH
jgi:hypothetical protein